MVFSCIILLALSLSVQEPATAQQKEGTRRTEAREEGEEGTGKSGSAKRTGKSTSWFRLSDKNQDLPPRIQKSQPQIPNPFSLQIESLEEIKKIRERIGIKLFDDPKSNQEFKKQLDEINNKAAPPTRSLSDDAALIKPRTSMVPSFPLQPANRKSVLSPTFRDFSVRPSAAKETKRPIQTKLAGEHSELSTESSRRTAIINSLAATIEQMDQLALELEKQGDAAKSKKMRKLSRRIQKQLLELTASRDN